MRGCQMSWLLQVENNCALAEDCNCSCNKSCYKTGLKGHLLIRGSLVVKQHVTANTECLVTCPAADLVSSLQMSPSVRRLFPLVLMYIQHHHHHHHHHRTLRLCEPVQNCTWDFRKIWNLFHENFFSYREKNNSRVPIGFKRLYYSANLKRIWIAGTCPKAPNLSKSESTYTNDRQVETCAIGELLLHL